MSEGDTSDFSALWEFQEIVKEASRKAWGEPDVDLQFPSGTLKLHKGALQHAAYFRDILSNGTSDEQEVLISMDKVPHWETGFADCLRCMYDITPKLPAATAWHSALCADFLRLNVLIQHVILTIQAGLWTNKDQVDDVLADPLTCHLLESAPNMDKVAKVMAKHINFDLDDVHMPQFVFEPKYLDTVPSIVASAVAQCQSSRWQTRFLQTWMMHSIPSSPNPGYRRPEDIKAILQFISPPATPKR